MDLKVSIGLTRNPAPRFQPAFPADGATVSSPVTLDWEDSTYPVRANWTYNLYYTVNPAGVWKKVAGLTASNYNFTRPPAVRNRHYYWKVAADQRLHTTWCTPEYRSFTSLPRSNDLAESDLPREFAWKALPPILAPIGVPISFSLPKRDRLSLRYMISGPPVAVPPRATTPRANTRPRFRA